MYVVSKRERETFTALKIAWGERPGTYQSWFYFYEANA